MRIRKKPFDYKINPLIGGGVKIEFFTEGEGVGSVLVRTGLLSWDYRRQLTQAGRRFMKEEGEALLKQTCTHCGATLESDVLSAIEEFENVNPDGGKFNMPFVGDLTKDAALTLEKYVNDNYPKQFSIEILRDTSLQQDGQCEGQNHYRFEFDQVEVES